MNLPDQKLELPEHYETASSTQVENHERFNPAAMPQDLGPRSAKSVRPREVSGAARRAKKKRERQNKKRGRK